MEVVLAVRMDAARDHNGGRCFRRLRGWGHTRMVEHAITEQNTAMSDVSVSASESSATTVEDASLRSGRPPSKGDSRGT